jgi:hypothetical protein
VPRDKDKAYSDEKTEPRATEALRRVLTTPFRPHCEIGWEIPTILATEA